MKNTCPDTMKTTLVCTVGGSPEPVIYGIRQRRPGRIFFAATAGTSDSISGIIAQSGFNGAYDTLLLSDGQDLSTSAAELRALIARHSELKTLAERSLLVVDFTGGTKVMAAAMALAFADLPVNFGYVGGSSRGKNGVGAVTSGAETVFEWPNPLHTGG